MCDDLSKKGHDYYFGSYSHFYIHEEMLKTPFAPEPTREPLKTTPKTSKTKSSWTSDAELEFFPIFAARAGAKHVYAIEFSEIALFAEEIIKRNGLSDKITVIKGKMEEITLPVPKVDISPLGP